MKMEYANLSRSLGSETKSRLSKKLEELVSKNYNSLWCRFPTFMVSPQEI